MDATEVRMLWVYAKELWGTTFEIPADQRSRAVKEQVWLDILGDLDPGLIRRTMAASGLHFAPTPPEIRQLAQERQRVESGEPPIPDYDQALVKLRELVGRYGSYYTVNGSFGSKPTLKAAAIEFHPALWETIAALGWQEICASTNPETFRAQFREVYRSVTGRLERRSVTPPPILAAAAELSRQLGRGDD